MNKLDRKTELMDGLETDYIRVLYYDFEQKYKGDYRSYESPRLCTIIEGEKKVKINNQTNITYSKRDFIMLPPNSIVDMEINTPTRAVVFEIHDKLIDRVTKKVSTEFETYLDYNSNTNIIHETINPFVQNSIDKIYDTSLNGDKNKEFLIDLYAQEMIYNLLKIKSVHDMIHVNSDHFIHLSIKMMKERITEGISISEIAYELNMSPANFSTKFKKIMGLSPNEYFKNIKLIEAKKMLKDKSVTEVAYDLGYDNISHFIGLFKDRFGVTPKKYMMSESNGTVQTSVG